MAVELSVRPDAFAAAFAADLPAAMTDVLAVVQRPITVAALDAAAPVAAWRTLPSRYVVAAADRATHPDAQRFMAARAGALTVELDASARRRAVVPRRGRGRAARRRPRLARRGRADVKRTRTQRLSLLAAIMGSFVVGLDATVVNVALPAIEEDLGGGLAGQQWISNGYLLALASLILDRRIARRRVRRAARVLDRRARVRRGLDRLRARAEHRGDRRRPRAAGDVRRAALAGRAGGHRHRLPARPARRGDRLVDGVVGHRHRGRAAGGRAAHRRLLVALDLRPQRPVHRDHAGARGDGRAAARAAGRAPAGRLGRRGAVVPRARGADAGADPPAGVGLGRARRDRARARRDRLLRHLPLARVDDAVSDAAAGAVLAPQLQRRQPADVRDVRRAVGAVLLPRSCSSSRSPATTRSRPGW